MKRILSLATLLAIVLIAGCSKDNPTNTSTTGSVSGKVTSEIGGTAVSGVTLTIQETGVSTTSDASGNFTIGNIAPGDYHLNTVKTGFDDGFNDITITAGKTLTYDVILTPPLASGKGRIIGRVADIDGNPVAGATITTSPATVSVTTDAQGRYRIVPIDMEFYQVMAAKAGYVPDTTTGDLRFTDQADSVNLILVDSIPKKGLTTWLKFDGNAQDAMGQANGGTLQGATAVTDRFGAANGAVAFDGVSSYVTIPSAASLNLGGATSDFTIALWIRGDGRQPDGADVMVKGTESSFQELSKGYSFSTTTGSGGQLIINSLKGQSSVLYQFPSEYTNNYWSGNKWHMIVLTFTRTGKVAYRYSDGYPLTSLTLDNSDATQDFSSDSPLLFGKNVAGDKFFKGAVDDVRIYNRALTDQEVLMLYHERGWN